jgi:hypothetical protein
MSYNYEILGQTASPPFQYPYDVAVDINQNVYVADCSNNDLREIISSGGAVNIIGATGGFPLITGVAGCVPQPLFGPANTIVYTYVSGGDASQGQGYLKLVNTSGGGSVIATYTDLVFIYYDGDTGLNPIKPITCNYLGTHAYAVGGTGGQSIYDLSVPDPLADPTNCSVDSWYDSTWNVFDPAQQIMGIDLDYSTGILYFTSNGNVYSLDTAAPYGDTTFTLVLNWGTFELTGISVKDSQNIYLANSTNSTIIKYDSINNTTTIISTSYSFNSPYGLSLDPTGNIYVSDTNNSKIVKLTLQNVVCFKEGTKILTNQGYISIETLRKGDLVKTLNNSFVPIEMVGKKTMYNPAINDRIKDQLYILENHEYSELFEPLVITGCHSVLVDGFESEKQKEQVKEVLGKIYITDGKYRLPACVDTRSNVFLQKGDFTIYHIALENENYYGNYGVFANGLLVETCSRRYLKEYANMDLLESDK